MSSTDIRSVVEIAERLGLPVSVCRPDGVPVLVRSLAEYDALTYTDEARRP